MSTQTTEKAFETKATTNGGRMTNFQDRKFARTKCARKGGAQGGAP
jgi:general stress protein YciG